MAGGQVRTYEPQSYYQPPSTTPDDLPQSPLTQLQATPISEVYTPTNITYAPPVGASDYIDLHTNMLSYKGMTVPLNAAQAKKLRNMAAAICISMLKDGLEETNAE